MKPLTGGRTGLTVGGRRISGGTAVALVLLALASVWLPRPWSSGAESSVAASTSGTISGIVTEAGTGDPLEGICVSVSRDQHLYNIMASAKTSENGEYTVSGLATGNYKVNIRECWDVNPRTYLNFWYDGKEDFWTADSIAVAEGEVTAGINAELIVGGSISGTVTDAATGEPVESKCVTAVDVALHDPAGEHFYGMQSLTDAEGNYTVGALTAGTYKVLFRFCGDGPARYDDRWYQSKPDYDSADELEIELGEAIENIDVELLRLGAITGTVRDATTGNPLESICVSADGPVSFWWATTPTDSDGEYAILDLPTGEYKVVFHDCLSLPPLYGSQWWNNKPDSDSADLLSVEPGSIETGIDADLTLITPSPSPTPPPVSTPAPSPTPTPTPAPIPTAPPATPTTAPEIVVEDLTGELTAENLAQSLVGPGVAISNVTYTGDERAAGQFTGGESLIGLEAGIILSTGRAVDAAGPNESAKTGTNLGQPGDPYLSNLVHANTFDAAVLEFDFVPDSNYITLQYVFASEEYNEYAGSSFNDAVAILVNNENCALIPDPVDPDSFVPVTINAVNNGRPGVAPSNPQLYINNDPFHPDSTGFTVPVGELLNIEYDGLTTVLICSAPVEPGKANTVRLAIADGVDAIYDSAVFVMVDVPKPPPTPAPSPTPTATPSPTPVVLPVMELVWGDLDCDGSVSIGDAFKAARHLLGPSVSQELECPPPGNDVTADGNPQVWGDTDCDGVIGLGDAVKLARHLVGLSVSKTEPCPALGSQVDVVILAPE